MKKVHAFAVQAQNGFYSKTRAARDERGAAGVECGLLVALIAAVIIGNLQVLGGQFNAAFKIIATTL